MKKFSENIVCAYLYSITKYGYPPPAENTLKYIDEMASLGFQSIELEGIREEHLNKVYELKDDITQKLNKLELSVPYFCVVLPKLSSPDSEVIKHQLKTFEKGCEIAKQFGAKGVLDNAPLPPYQFPEDVPVVRHYGEEEIGTAYFPDNLDWKNYWDRLTATYSECCDIAANYDLTYQLHPALGLLSSNADAFLKFYDDVNRENLRFTFDTANQFAMKENLSLSLIRLAEFIDYIHISDNGGGRIEHLQLGKGKIRWDVFFDTLKKTKFNGYFGIDIGGDESSVADLDSAYIHAAEFLEKQFDNIK
ncbi:hypothetical protein MNBD_IGNAVI01-1832 [hydrothermal vent metagenome]|uniref:Xylose isomerase-like TIM barrel domain-containing protein n=1 Tax=hydrothermal vent metagenome TaxID=652676 RepID=A0A3B1D9S7_9ZZZZ